jgi:hypothetical protein
MYTKELIKNKMSLIIILSLIVLSYSVYFLNEKTVLYITSEDNLFEGGTAFFLLLSSILFFTASKKNIFMILLGLVFFFGAGEEISWGQRIFGFEPPEKIKEENVQGEFNIHNLPTFNGTKVKGKHIAKVGLARLTEMNFLYRLFILSFGVALPLITYHIGFFKKLVKKLKIPVPPVSMGLFFIVSWVVCKLVLKIVPKGYDQLYYNGANEIWEFLTAFIIFNFGIYFYKNRDKEIFGLDIKETTLLN